MFLLDYGGTSQGCRPNSSPRAGKGTRHCSTDSPMSASDPHEASHARGFREGLHPVGTRLLTRSRVVLEQEIQEPTLLAFVLTVAGFGVLLGVCGMGIAFLPAFGHAGWVFAALAAVLAWLVL